jgi:hypothetical protein
MLPLRLAGTLTFGARSTTSADWTVDGEVGSASVKITARLDGGPGGWRSGRADVTAQVEATDASKLAALLFPGSKPGGKAGAKPGRVLVRAGGVPSAGLASVVTVDAADVALSFRGQVRLAEPGAKADGDLEVKAGNGTVLATLVGLGPTVQLDGVPVNARLKLAVDGTTIGMDKLSLQLGESRLTGRLALSPAGERRRIDADLQTDDVSVTTLLSPLLDSRFGAADAAEAALLGQRIPWPDVPFSGAVLDAFEGHIRLASKRLVLTDGMALEGAKIDVVLEPGKVDVKEISGAALGGQVKATIRIEKAPAGAEVRGTLGFGIALEEIAGAGPAKAGGPVSGTLKVAGRGLSPRAVIAALTGEGSIVLDEVKLPGLAPRAVAAAAEAALKAEAGKLAAALRKTLATRLATDLLPVGQATFALEIADGHVRSKSMLIETPEGRAVGSTRVDLNAFQLDSQWRLEPKPPATGSDAAKRLLPPVVVSYRAPLAALKDAEQQIDTTAIEQELAARKIEQDLEELQRLRALDESKRELERLRALDESKSKAESKSGEPAPPPTAPSVLPGAPVPPAGSGTAPGAPG